MRRSSLLAVLVPTALATILTTGPSSAPDEEPVEDVASTVVVDAPPRAEPRVPELVPRMATLAVATPRLRRHRTWAESLAPGLAWLAAHQSGDGRFGRTDHAHWCDGRWTGDLGDDPAEPRDVATTGLALLAFLGDGFTNRSDDSAGFGRSVASGLRWLKSVQGDDGTYGEAESPQRLHDHAIAACAMLEVFGMTGSVVYRDPAMRALRLLVAARREDGSWPATRGGPGDAATTAWAVGAIQRARLIDAADLRQGLSAVFATVLATPAAGTTTEIAWARSLPDRAPRRILLAYLAGLRKEPVDVPALRAAARDAVADPGTAAEWTHFAMLAALVAGGDARAALDADVTTPLDEARRADGDACSGAGSYDSPAARLDPLGPVGVTALAETTLALRWAHVHVTPPSLASASPAETVDAAPEAPQDPVEEVEDSPPR